MHVLLVLEEGAVQRRDQLSGIALAQGLGLDILVEEQLDPVEQLLNEDIAPETLRESDPRKLIPPLHGALLKNEQDVHLFERLAFLARRQDKG